MRQSAMDALFAREKKACLKQWRSEYEAEVYAAAPMLRELKLEIILEDAMVWWTFSKGRRSPVTVVLDQCFHTGDWLRYVEQGYGPLHQSKWVRTSRPYFRVCVETFHPATVNALLLKYKVLGRNVCFTSDLSWPGSSEKNFLAHHF